jgi:hypothetical protein
MILSSLAPDHKQASETTASSESGGAVTQRFPVQTWNFECRCWPECATVGIRGVPTRQQVRNHGIPARSINLYSNTLVKKKRKENPQLTALLGCSFYSNLHRSNSRVTHGLVANHHETPNANIRSGGKIWVRLNSNKQSFWIGSSTKKKNTARDTSLRISPNRQPLNKSK